MRLLLVNERLEYASATSYTVDLATSLREAGDEVRICTLGGIFRSYFRERGIETYRVRPNLLSRRKLNAFMRDYRPEIVHAQSLESLPLARRLASRLDTPLVVTVHRPPAKTSPRLAAAGLTGVVAVSEVVRTALVNEQGLSKGTIRVIRRGIRYPKPRGDARRAPGEGLHGRIPVVGSIGRLIPEKGHGLFVQAARNVLDRGLEAHFAVVGEGKDERRLRSRVRELGLERHLTFLPPVPSRVHLYGLFDIVALPVLSSGVGVTALEAMAAGKPLVATGVGELLELVQDGRTGLLVPEGQTERLAERLGQLIGDPGLAEQLGRRAREWVARSFALEPMVNATREYYGEVLAGVAEGRALQAARR